MKDLDEKYNIQVIFQIPRSPYCNVLDLGVWCGLQSAVEKRHFQRRAHVEALVMSVMETWDKGHLNDIISKVFGRLQKVLVLVVEGKGSNELVETKRGKQHVRNDLPPDETAADEESNNNQTNGDSIPPPTVPNFSDFLDEEEDDACEVVGCEM